MKMMGQPQDQSKVRQKASCLLVFTFSSVRETFSKDFSLESKQTNQAEIFITHTLLKPNKVVRDPPRATAWDCYALAAKAEGTLPFYHLGVWR